MLSLIYTSFAITGKTKLKVVFEEEIRIEEEEESNEMQNKQEAFL